MNRSRRAFAGTMAGLFGFVLLFALGGRTVRAADPVELDLRKGSITITENGYIQYEQEGQGAQEKAGKDYIIKGYKEVTSNTVSVTSGEHNITFSDVYMDRTLYTGSNGTVCFNVGKSSAGDKAVKVNLTLEGENSLQGISSAVTVGGSFPDAELCITQKSTGTLNATGGTGLMQSNYGYAMSGIEVIEGCLRIEGGTVVAKGGRYSAGIEAGRPDSTRENVIITGGQVKATGGTAGAGIGGIYGRGCGNITISGGAVEATGGVGESASPAKGAGAGIGSGGARGNQDQDKDIKVGTIKLTGGVITAKSGAADASGSGGSTDAAGIGAGGSVDTSQGGMLLLGSNGTGNAWVDASSVRVRTDGKELNYGVLFDGAAGQMYGSNYTYTSEQNLGIPVGKTLNIAADQTLKMTKSYVLTLNTNSEIANEGIIKLADKSRCVSSGGNGISGNGKQYAFRDGFDKPENRWYEDGKDFADEVKAEVKEKFEQACQESPVSGSTDDVILDPPVLGENADYTITISPEEVTTARTYTVTVEDKHDGEKIEKTFEVYSQDRVESLRIVTPPSKTNYVWGQSFATEGMEVVAVYHDGTEEVIPPDQLTIKNGSNLAMGQTKVFICYTDASGNTTSDVSVDITVERQTIDVSAIDLDSIAASFTYSGSEQIVTVKDLNVNLPAGMSDVVEMKILGGDRGKNAGTYDAEIAFSVKRGYEDLYVLSGTENTPKVKWSIEPKILTWVTDGLTAVGNIRSEQVPLYGEIGVAGIFPADLDQVNAVFSTEKLMGIYKGGQPGDEQEIMLVWRDEDDKLTFGSEGVAGNYVLPEMPPSVKGVINDVEDLPLPPELAATAGVRYMLSLETGISNVPEALQDDPDLDLPDKIEKSLISAVMEKNPEISQGYITSYDLALLSRGAGDSEWKAADADAVPSTGLTVTIPYPAGITGETYDCVVAYMYPDNTGDERAGTIVYLEAKKTEDGIQFKIPGPAPFSLGWAPTAEEPGGDNPPGDDPGDNPGDDPGDDPKDDIKKGFYGDPDGGLRDNSGDGSGGGSGNGSGDGSGSGGGSDSGGGSGNGSGDGSGSSGGSDSGGGSGSGGGSASGNSSGSSTRRSVRSGDQTAFMPYAVLTFSMAAVLLVFTGKYRADRGKRSGKGKHKMK